MHRVEWDVTAGMESMEISGSRWQPWQADKEGHSEDREWLPWTWETGDGVLCAGWIISMRWWGMDFRVDAPTTRPTQPKLAQIARVPIAGHARRLWQEGVWCEGLQEAWAMCAWEPPTAGVMGKTST